VILVKDLFSVAVLGPSTPHKLKGRDAMMTSHLFKAKTYGNKFKMPPDVQQP